MTTRAFDQDRPDPSATWLDRPLALGAVGWATVGWVAALSAAAVLRFAKLDAVALSPAEAVWAYDAWRLFRGEPTIGAAAVPQTAPLFLLAEAFAFFLFGTTDAVARMVPAVFGLGTVALLPLLRRWLGGSATLGAVALVAVSPILVGASRVATPEALVAFLTLLLAVAVLRLGAAAEDGEPAAARRSAVLVGVALGALPAAGPAGLTALVALGVGFAWAARDADGAVRRAFVALGAVSGALAIAASSAIATLLTLFTRFFSDPAGVVGIAETLGAWFGLLLTDPPQAPTTFVLLAVVSYEPLAVVGAVVGAVRGRGAFRDGPIGALFGAWFVAALLLWSLSSGRSPNDAAQVALPLVLLGGAALGATLSRLDGETLWRGRGGLLALAIAGLVVALVALGVLLGRASGAIDVVSAAVPAVVVTMLVLVPLAYAVWTLVRSDRDAGRGSAAARVALLVVAVILGAYALRSATLLAFERAADGSELVSQRTSTAAVRPLVDRLDRLARDVSLFDGSLRDTTGGNGLSIAAEAPVAWPFRWYFRDFPDFTVVTPGDPALANAQVALAIGGTDLGTRYTTGEYPWLTNVPDAYEAPDLADLVRKVFDPREWFRDARFLLFRDGIEVPAPSTVVVGLDGPLAARVYPPTGPFGLDDRPGAGAADGQLNQPVGVAAAPDGTVYVVDQGNSRIARYDAAGDFLGTWGEAEGIDLAQTETGLGPTGIAAGPDGTLYVADTWNHRVLVADAAGAVVREIGAPAGADGARIAADTTDDPAAVSTRPGEFFGPRAVAVAGDEVYVVDTGNERVQVFGLDGEFRRIWGGYGSEPNRLLEPVGIAIGPDGLVYVADSGNGRVSSFTSAGEPVAQWPVPVWPVPEGERPAFQPYLAFGPDGALYVSSLETGSVEVFDRAGSVVASIQDVEGERLAQPIGLAFASDGTLLITDLGRNAVLRYAPPERPLTDAASPVEEGAASPATNAGAAATP